jgi:hypothetical protein
MVGGFAVLQGRWRGNLISQWRCNAQGALPWQQILTEMAVPGAPLAAFEPERLAKLVAVERARHAIAPPTHTRDSPTDTHTCPLSFCRSASLEKEVQTAKGRLIATQNQLETALMEADMLRMEKAPGMYSNNHHSISTHNPRFDSRIGGGSGSGVPGLGSPAGGERRQREAFRSKAAGCRLLYRYATKGGTRRALGALIGLQRIDS